MSGIGKAALEAGEALTVGTLKGVKASGKIAGGGFDMAGAAGDIAGIGSQIAVDAVKESAPAINSIVKTASVATQEASNTTSESLKVVGQAARTGIGALSTVTNVAEKVVVTAKYTTSDKATKAQMRAENKQKEANALEQEMLAEKSLTAIKAKAAVAKKNQPKEQKSLEKLEQQNYASSSKSNPVNTMATQVQTLSKSINAKSIQRALVNNCLSLVPTKSPTNLMRNLSTLNKGNARGG